MEINNFMNALVAIVLCALIGYFWLWYFVGDRVEKAIPKATQTDYPLGNRYRHRKIMFWYAIAVTIFAIIIGINTYF